MLSPTEPALSNPSRRRTRVHALSCQNASSPMVARGESGEPIQIHSPFNPEGFLSLDSLRGPDTSQLYLPLDLLHLAPERQLFLLPMLRLDQLDGSTIWFLDSNLQFQQERPANALEIATLYRFVQSRPLASAWLMDQPASTRHAFLNCLRRLNQLCLEAEQHHDRHGMEIGPAEPVVESSSFFEALVAWLMPANPVQALLEQLQSDPGSLPGCDAFQLMEMLEFLAPRALFPEGNCLNSNLLSHANRYSLLLELHLLQTGKDLVFNPISGRHQQAEMACFIPTDKSVSSAFSVNKAVLFRHGDVELLELRGPGFCGFPTGYQIGTRAFVKLSPAASTWIPKDYGRYVAHCERYIAKARQRPASGDNNTLNLVNLTLGTNLRHTLWNDVSGYYLVRDLLAAFPQLSQRVRISCHQGETPTFSNQSYNDFFHPLLANDLGEFGLDAIEDFQAFADLPKPMMLHGLLVPASLAEAMRNHFAARVEPRREPSQLRLLINLRAHNKSLLNTAECLDVWLASEPTVHLRSRLHVSLELHTSATAMADGVSAVLTQHGIAHQRLVNCTLDALCEEISLASVVIAPVGSALVLPTWIWNRHCVAHGDPMHMTQLTTWPGVAPFHPDLQDHLHAIPEEAIHAEGTALYSNYRVEPLQFAAQLQAALDAALAE
jgi:hypothetical protein